LERQGPVIPQCSPCGLGLDWIRSCYSSTWHLFNDSPRTRTPGRYYFTTAQFLQGFHNLGSRNWNDLNNGIGQGLGEDIAWPQTWDRGDPPPVLPNAEVVGSAECITNGESIANAIPFTLTDSGLPFACWVPHVEGDPIWSKAGAWYSCSMQYFYATAITLLYNRDEPNLTLIFTQLLGPTITTHFHMGTTQLPDVFIVKSPDCTVILVDGTMNFQQLALQVFLGVHGPLNQGIFSTLDIWYTAASWVNAWAGTDGVDPALPVILCGHSYGAAACNVLAARYRYIRPLGQVRLMTFGDPKPGDVRMARILGGTAGLALANDDDLVTIICPDATTIWPVSVSLANYTLVVWDQWKRPPNQALQRQDGSLNFNRYAVTDFNTLRAASVNAIGNLPLGVITGHFLSQYRSRILARCPSAEWPVSNALLVLLKTF
jgi:Lipase (class 3)